MINGNGTLQQYAIYTGEELTQLFGIAPHEYKNAFKDGKLHGKRFGQKYRFGGGHLKAYLEQHRGRHVAFFRATPTQGSAALDLAKEKLERRKENKRRMIRVRWLILVRDNFTCQYCGRKAPQVELEVDHRIPVSQGGQTAESNLVTACKECNRGKRDDILTCSS